MDKLVIVHEKDGFLTSKKLSEVDSSDTFICVTDSEEAVEAFIHGFRGENKYEMVEQSDGVKFWSKK